MLGMYELTLVAAALSFLSSICAVVFFIKYDREKPSRVVRMVTMLILSDGMASACFVLWAFLELYEKEDKHWCRMFLPFPTLFFLMGFGYMILIAHRFKEINQSNSESQLFELPLWIVPLVSLILIIPIATLNAVGAGFEVSELIESHHEDGREFCYFSSNRDAFIANAICFHVPSIFTVVYNVYAYFKGLHALKDSPHTVRTTCSKTFT
jgi:hypothetical protein